MIEYRAILRRDLEFQSGNKLAAGTIIYAEATEHGWIGSHYSEKGSSTSFALDAEDFSIFQRGETGIEYLVVSDPPAESDDEIAERAELARKRLSVKAKEYRREAAKIEKLLKAGKEVVL